jgi:uncharacterized protein YecT (DUF1311 family)
MISKAILKIILIVCSAILYSPSVSAIDNPDTPDHVGEFLIRAQAHESAIEREVHTTQGYASAYAAYETFLDKELNKTYNLLMDNLQGNAQQTLRSSQKMWLKFRDTEFKFITLNFAQENFGSSSVISRGGYRTTIIKNRVILLLDYLKNY